jgi:hypothetical protein
VRKKQRKAALEAQRAQEQAQHAQKQAQAASVLALVEQAFDGVAAPDADHRTLYQAEAWDSYEKIDQRRDHRGRWQDLPDAHIQSCNNALYHVDEQGIQYYLPAIMCHFIRSPRNRNWMIHDCLFYILRPNVGDLKTHQRREFSLLTAPQRAAILAFLEYAEVPEQDVIPWRRVVEAGDASDWFRRFY